MTLGGVIGETETIDGATSVVATATTSPDD